MANTSTMQETNPTQITDDLIASHNSNNNNSEGTAKSRIIYLLVIAHPDDEIMFFYPTIRSIVGRRRKLESNLSNSNKNKKNGDITSSIHILCLSNGNYDLLGKIRHKEMVRACQELKVDSVEILNDDRLQDGPNECWDRNVISNLVGDYIYKKIPSLSLLPAMNKNSDDRNNTISTTTVNILTFDQKGVSYHPNHVDCCEGVRHFIQYGDRREKIAAPSSKDELEIGSVKGFELVTQNNIVRKYVPIFDWFMCFFFLPFISCFLSASTSNKNSYGNDSQVNVLTSFQPWDNWTVMKCHQSQFVWYRKLSIWFSSYTYVNMWREMEY